MVYKSATQWERGYNRKNSGCGSLPRYRSNPTDCQIDRDGNDPNDPQCSIILTPVVAEDDGEDDSAEISHASDDA